MSDGDGFQVPPELSGGMLGRYFDEIMRNLPTLDEMLARPTPLDQIPEALGGTRKHWTDTMIDSLVAAELIGDVSNWQPTGLDPQGLKWLEAQGRPNGPHDPFGWTRHAEPHPLDALFIGNAEYQANVALIRKLSAVIQVPDELLMDAGVIPDTRPPRPPLPWKWRMRNRVAGWREKLACRAFRVVAGYDAPDYAGDE